MTDANTGGCEPAQLELKLFDKPLFRLGQILATPGALATLARLGVHPLSLVLGRHVVGDWGDLCEEDRELNIHSLANGMRIFSSYKLTSTVGDTTTTETVWVITEADRASTVTLLPSEY
jgi:hypothetical protein